MHISFVPALGQTTSLAVPPQADSVQLRFTARFHSRHEFEQARREGVKVEVWTDSQAGGRAAGEWGPLAFEWGALDGIDKPSSSALSLHPPGANSTNGDADLEQDDLTLQLAFCARLSAQTAFAYTYRLVYPSGHIKWLGEFGRNGVLAFEHRDPRVLLTEGWQADLDSLIWAGTAHEVAQLSAEFEWAIWALGRTTPPRLYTLGEFFSDASVAYFFPHTRTASIIIQQPFYLHNNGNHDSVMSLTPNGSVVFTRPNESGGCSLSLYMLDQPPTVSSDLPAWRDNLGEPVRSIGYQLIGSTHTSSYFTVASPPGVSPTTVTVIPLHNIQSAVSTVSIPLQNLADLVPTASQFSVFSYSSPSPFFFSVPQEKDFKEDVMSFSVGREGGQFVVSSVYSLGEAEGTWQLSVLTQHDQPHIRMDGHPDHLSSESEGRLAAPAIANPRTNSEMVLRTLPRNQVYIYVRYILSVLTVLFQTMFIRIYDTFYRTRSAPTAASIQGLREKRAQTPLLQGDHRVGPPAESSPAVSVPLLDKPNHTTAIGESNGHKPGRTDVEPTSAFFTKVLSGKVTMLLRSERTGALLEEVSIKVDEDVIKPSTKQLEEGIYLVEFCIQEGRSLKVSASSSKNQ